MKLRSLTLTFILAITSIASAAEITIGINGDITWIDIATAHPEGTYEVIGADGQPMGNIGLSGGDSTTYTVAVNDEMIAGTFGLTITALPLFDPVDRAIALHSGGSLIIDETDNFGGADNNNINGAEILQFSITSRSLTSLDGGLPSIQIVSFLTEGLNPTEFLSVLKNDSIIIEELQGDAANLNAVNQPVEIPSDQSILRDNDTLSFTHSAGSAYRLRSITLSVTSVEANPISVFFDLDTLDEPPAWLNWDRASWLYVASFPWIYSNAKESWLYALGNSLSQGAWFYDLSENSYWFTVADYFPWIYRPDRGWVLADWAVEPAGM